MKQKLHKIELEMSKLQSKQVEMEKDGKSNLLSRSGRLFPQLDHSSCTTHTETLHGTSKKERKKKTMHRDRAMKTA